MFLQLPAFAVEEIKLETKVLNNKVQDKIHQKLSLHDAFEAVIQSQSDKIGNVFEKEVTRFYFKEMAVEGFSEKESWGWWSDADISTTPSISLQLPKEIKPQELKNYFLSVEIPHIFLPQKESKISLKVFGNGRHIMDFDLTQNSRPLFPKIPFNVLAEEEDHSLKIQFEIAGSSSPRQYGLSADKRSLGIGINRVFLQKDIFAIPDKIETFNLENYRTVIFGELKRQFDCYRETGIEKRPESEFAKMWTCVQIQIIDNKVYAKNHKSHYIFDSLPNTLKEISKEKILPNVDFFTGRSEIPETMSGAFGASMYIPVSFSLPFVFTHPGFSQYAYWICPPQSFNKKIEKIYFRGYHTNFPDLIKIYSGYNRPLA